MAKNTKPMNNWNYLFYLGQGVEDTMWFYRLLGKLGTQKKSKITGAFYIWMILSSSFIIHQVQSTPSWRLAICPSVCCWNRPVRVPAVLYQPNLVRIQRIYFLLVIFYSYIQIDKNLQTLR